MSVFEKLSIVPVVVLDSADAGPSLAAALTAGGIPGAEITLRTPAGMEAISRIAAAHPDFVVGAGTVVAAAEVDQAADAGAQFVVSPGLDPAIVDRARARGLEVLPGAATATEVQHAQRLGLSRVKFFPAAQLGGLPVIEALTGPFPHMRFMPSGGVSPGNAREYLASEHVFAVSGSWMVPRELIADSDWAGIEQLSAAAVAAVR